MLEPHAEQQEVSMVAEVEQFENLSVCTGCFHHAKDSMDYLELREKIQTMEMNRIEYEWLKIENLHETMRKTMENRITNTQAIH